MVGPLEQAILALMIFVIMLGMGASLTPRDFVLTLKRPFALFIGLVGQYGFLPFIAFMLAFLLPLPDPIKIGLLIMGCMPGGTTSNIFTYFAKGNLALSVLMTVNSTIFGVVMIPLLLVVYAGALDLDIPRGNIIITLILLLVPAAIGMGLRKWNANVGAVTEFGGSLLGIVFILFLIVSWIPRNFDLLLATGWATYFAVIALGILGFIAGYVFSTFLKLHPRNSRTVALEIGIQNGPLAIAIIAFTFGQTDGQQYMIVPALYSLFIVISATALTLWFRRIEDANEQKMPDGLL
ncbi:MAG: bile acid:sodium symporter family protein [Notoacmeibacter sp.]